MRRLRHTRLHVTHSLTSRSCHDTEASESRHAKVASSSPPPEPAFHVLQQRKEVWICRKSVEGQGGNAGQGRKERLKGRRRDEPSIQEERRRVWMSPATHAPWRLYFPIWRTRPTHQPPPTHPVIPAHTHTWIHTLSWVNAARNVTKLPITCLLPSAGPHACRYGSW